MVNHHRTQVTQARTHRLRLAASITMPYLLCGAMSYAGGGLGGVRVLLLRIFEFLVDIICPALSEIFTSVKDLDDKIFVKTLAGKTICLEVFGFLCHAFFQILGRRGGCHRAPHRSHGPRLERGESHSTTHGE